jgi:transcription initiation factor IIE alpha subunit
MKELIQDVKALALTGQFSNEQVCQKLNISDAILQKVLWWLYDNDREFRAAGPHETGE